MKRLLLLLLLLAPVPALAECMSPGPPAVSYAAATAVFVATISPTGDRGFRFTRGKSWKGDAPAEFVLRLDPNVISSTDLHVVQEGVEYIVYAIGDLQVDQCNRRKVLKQARIEAQYLDVLQAGAAVELAPGARAVAQDEPACIEAAGLMDENRSSRKDERMLAWLMPAVVQCAGDRSAVVRLAAVRALGNTRSGEGAQVRIAALMDKDREVRTAAVPAVEGISNSALFPALAAALKLARAEPDPDLGKQESLLASFASALRSAAMTEAEKDDAGKLLRELIDEIKDPMKRLFPLRYLGLIGPRVRAASVPQLRRILQASDPTEQHYLKQYAISALGELGAVDMQASIEPYLKDENCNVAAAVVHAVWKMNQAGFGKFFAETGMPEMQSRFDRCNDLFIGRLQDMVPAGRELAPFLTAKYAAMADSDAMKPRLKRLLDSWRAAP